MIEGCADRVLLEEGSHYAWPDRLVRQQCERCVLEHSVGDHGVADPVHQRTRWWRVETDSSYWIDAAFSHQIDRADVSPK